MGAPRGHGPRGLALAAVVFWAAMAGSVPAQTEFRGSDFLRSAEPIEVTIRLEPAAPPAGGECMLLAQVVLAPGVHLYQESLRFELTETRGVDQPRVSLPPAEEIPDPFGLGPGGSVAVYEDALTLTAVFPVTGSAGDTLVIRGELHYQGCTDEVCYPPASKAFSYHATIAASAEPSAEPTARPRPVATETPSTLPSRIAAVQEPEPAAPAWVSALVGAFVAGLLLSLTPCVYPMIPITAAVVAGATARPGREGGEAGAAGRAFLASLIYVLGLSLVYALLGLASASLGGVLRRWLQSAVVRVPMAAVFAFLALVMFGALRFEFSGGLGTRLQRLGARSGFFGLFLIGAGAGLVASPCLAAPLAAVLIQIARTGDRWLGFWTLFSLAWGMGIILVVAGTFSGSLLPRAGAWMYLVKNLFGFVMLWAVVWILQPLLGSDVYHLSVGLVVVAAVVYLGGLDALVAESGVLQRTKRFAGLAALALGMVYLVLGLGGLLGLELGGKGGASQQGIRFIESDTQGLDAALASGQPVLVSFHAEWCGVCKQLDRTTFRDPEVVQEASRFIALKVDFDANADLANRYRVINVPTTLVFAPGESARPRSLVGKVSAEELLAEMRQVR